MIDLTRRYRFPAAHVLAHPHLSSAENDRIYGKCANPGGHGHDYGLEVTVRGAVDARSGQVADREAWTPSSASACSSVSPTAC